MDASRIRKKKFAFSQIFGYVWTTPKTVDSARVRLRVGHDVWNCLTISYPEPSLPLSSGTGNGRSGNLVPNLVPRVLRLFGQRGGARRDSGIMEKYHFFDWSSA